MSDEPTKPSPAPKPFLLLKSIVSRVPLSDSDQEKAAKLISQCTLEELQSLNLGPPPRPIPPKFTATAADKVPPQQRLSQVQRVISSLQYNHHAGYFYNVSKDRPWSRVMDTARELLATALPIKCIEAVFLGAYLTAGWLDLDRIPIGFKSRSHQDQEVHRHIVLVVRHFPSGKYGALGISRRKELMDKELKFESLRDILTNYRESYDMWGHKLLKVYVGLPLDHDLLYNGMAIWRYLHLNAAKHKWSKCCNQLDLFEDHARRLAAKVKLQGILPPPSAALAGGGGGGSVHGSTAVLTNAASAVAPNSASVVSPNSASASQNNSTNSTPSKSDPPPPAPSLNPITNAKTPLPHLPSSPSGSARAKEGGKESDEESQGKSQEESQEVKEESPNMEGHIRQSKSLKCSDPALDPGENGSKNFVAPSLAPDDPMRGVSPERVPLRKTRKDVDDDPQGNEPGRGG
eukprot:CAMPEP_0175068984 /NCGR_PEP_ID=MMETSP0052_2-20121109/17960_1 /TAXON_ID=51329 ORGANISM="Polytomella parva, Strain SAG 63-3" /NCGR_SAMPLE_ID=MMETSP0052_2 /ASSEMBLY_ACC=CAM_ASM_000194 /LENGTH=460 /DNA_ID=CAMNT_0016336043 /DNA_START=177 /DNA_END=1556 /DNA_ORIENTATION=+